MNHYLAIAVGGCLGSVARYGLSGAVLRDSGGDIPYASPAVDVLVRIVWDTIPGKRRIEARATILEYQRYGSTGPFWTPLYRAGMIFCAGPIPSRFASA